MGMMMSDETTIGYPNAALRADIQRVAWRDGFVPIDHHLLSFDLTRPAHRDLCARWMAEQSGMKIGPTAPIWECDGGRWILTTQYTLGRYFDDLGVDEDEWPRENEGDPAVEAMRRACLAIAKEKGMVG